MELSQSAEFLAVYPNLFNGEFKININNNQNGNITIVVYNTMGIMLKSFNDIKDGDYAKELKLSGFPQELIYSSCESKWFCSIKIHHH